eukprot:scaffold499810_cov37-Prasinocladus_malaysianus.AAC.1
MANFVWTIRAPSQFAQVAINVVDCVYLCISPFIFFALPPASCPHIYSLGLGHKLAQDRASMYVLCRAAAGSDDDAEGKARDKGLIEVGNIPN